MSDFDDSTLLRDYCATRSESAFTGLVRRHLPMVFHAALRRLQSPALAEEAAQNAFTRLAAKAPAVARHPERLRAWLHRTAFLEACTIARKETRLSRLPLPPQPASEPMNRPEIYDRLDEALNSLPELDRELILRRCCGGEDFRRIAAAVGKSETACQKRVERALVRLGQTLGGAGAMSVIATALSAGSMRATAMPSAEHVAAAALQKSAGSSAAGALSGLAAAACVAATLTGGALGWQREEPVPSPPAVSKRASASNVATPAATGEVSLQQAAFSGSLDDVLESIQAGRLGPLIAFLPTATPSDLRAIIAEDDFAGLGEGSPSRSEAHMIALRHWAAIEPAGAFVYGVSRDRENTGPGMPVAALALAAWMRADSGAALTAFAALSQSDRSAIVASMGGKDTALADQLLQAHPDLLWHTATGRFWDRQTGSQPSAGEKDEQLVEAVLAGKQDANVSGGAVVDAFTRLAFKNASAALARAAGIPEPKLRDRVIRSLRRQFLSRLPVAELQQITGSLPPGLERSRAIGHLGGQLAPTQPDEALRWLGNMPPGVERDVAWQHIASVMAGADPWKLLETTAALRGPVSNAEQAMKADGFHNDIPWHDDALKRALTFAGRDDPKRALALLPDILAKMGRRGGGVEALTLPIVTGWMETDMAGAIRWVAATGSASLKEKFWIGINGHDGDAAPLIAMLPAATEAERFLAHRALGNIVESAIQNGTAEDLIAQIPRSDADEILAMYAGWAGARTEIEDALRFANLASPACRTEKILPDIACEWLKDDAPAAVEWIRTLTPAERQAVLNTAAAAKLTPEAHAALQQLTP